MNAKRILISIGSLFLFAFLFSFVLIEKKKFELTSSTDKQNELVVALSEDVPGYFSADENSFGYHYDILTAYADEAGLSSLRIIKAKNREDCEYLLKSGYADIAITLSDPQSKNLIPVRAYTTHYTILSKEGRMHSRQTDFDFSELKEKKVVVSSDFSTSADFSCFMDSARVHDVSVFVSGEDAVSVSSRLLEDEYDYYICENIEGHVVSAFKRRFTEVYSFPGQLAINFVIPDSKGGEVDFRQWFAEYKESTEYHVLGTIYEQKGLNSHLIGKLTNLHDQSKLISDYDFIMRQVCESENVDWRLLSAICYNESRFQPDVVSRCGARGLMQIMPIVARQFGTPKENIMDPETNIMLAVKLIKEIENTLRLPSDTPYNDRMSIILASYNGGIGHVQDARRLARKYGGNRNSWKDVSHYLRCKASPAYSSDAVVRNGAFRGSGETIAFVNNVMSRYDRYCSL